MKRTWVKTAKLLSSAMVLSLLAGPVMAPDIAWARSSSEKSVGFVEKARGFVKQGQWRPAVIELKNALQADPDNVEARILLGDVYLKTYNGASAEKEFGAARQRGAKDPSLILRMARAYELQRKYDDILKTVQVNAVPKNQTAEAYLVRGNAYLGLQKVDDATAAYEQAQKIAPENAEVQTGLARIYLLKRQIDKATVAINQALKLDPRSVDALLIKSEMERMNNNFPSALKYLTSAVEVQPNYLPALMSRAAVLVELAKDAEALGDLDRIDKLAPNHPTAHYLRARIKWRTKDIKGASEELAKTGTALDNFLPSVFLKGLVNFAQGNLEQAAFNLSRVVEFAPNHEGGRRVLGMTLLRQEEPTKAIQVLQPLIDKGTKDSKIYSMVGYAYMKLGKLDESAKYFDLAVKIDPKESANRTRQAVSRMALGEYDTAIDTLESVVKDDPKSLQAAVILVMAELKKSDYKAATAAAQKLEKTFPKNAAGPYLLGEAYLQQNNLVASRQAFERAKKLSTDNTSINMKLAAVDVAERKFDAAAARYKEILAKKQDYAPAMMALSELATRAKNTPEAVSWLEKAAAVAKSDINPGLRLIDIYVSQRQFDKALAQANAMTQANPNLPIAFEALGKVQVAAGDKAGAIATFERLTNMQPENPGTYHLLARAEILSKQRVEARESLRKALKVAKSGGKVDADVERLGTPLTILLDLIDLDLGDKKYDSALSVAGELDKYYPKTSVADLTRGNIHLTQKKSAEALAYFQKAEATGPRNGGLMINYYRAYRAQGNAAKGIATLEGWLKTNPGDVAVKTVLGSAYLETGQNAKALPLYEGLVAKYPASPQYLNNLAWLYQQAGNPKALDVAARAYRAAPNSPEIIDTYGWLLVKQGKAAQAVPFLKKASALRPAMPDLKYHLAVALQATGDKAGAVKLLQEAVKSTTPFAEAADAKKLLASLSK